jgi:hypothetical protein
MWYQDERTEYSRGKRRQRLRGTLLETRRAQSRVSQEVRPCTTQRKFAGTSPF